MNEGAVTINELIARMLAEMRRLGYSEESIWRLYVPQLNQIRKFYTKERQTFYSLDTTHAFIQLQEERKNAGDISSHSLYRYRHYSRRMDEFYLTGTLRVNQQRKKTRYPLNADNERLLDLFLDFHKYGDKARSDSSWVVRRYLNYWENHGHPAIGEVSADEVRNFIIETAQDVTTASMYNVMLYLKHFHLFLKAESIPAPDCIELFSNRTYCSRRVQGYVTDEELGKILSVIDSETESGKRDRAIILLAATTGLRACDIIHMKLTDIDWRKREIRLIQAKTETTVYVPLIDEADAALQDYILNARPSQTGCQEVFLRMAAPRTAIRDTTSINCMFKSYQKKAGIIRQNGDGKGFHGLRRRFAKKLLVSGTPLTTISQLLGHNDEASVRQYLSLNTENLKECALDFRGIPIERRALQ